MSAGGYYTAGSDSLSAARANQKQVTIDTGTNLFGLSPTYPCQLVCATDNSSGSFVAGQLYQRNAANSAWVPFPPMAIHDHTAATAAAGGTLNAVMSNNMGQFIYQNDLISPRASEFRIASALSVGGTITDNNTAGQWSVKCDTGAVTNNTAQADFGGLAVDFGSPLRFQTKVNQAAVTSNVQARIGINIETVQLAVSNTTKMLGMEFCDSTGAFYIVVSGDGTTRSTQATSSTYGGTNVLRMIYTPSVSVTGLVNTAGTVVTKTNNLPNSGACDPDKVMRFGIMTKTTTTQDLSIFGAAMCYVPNEVNWML